MKIRNSKFEIRNSPLKGQATLVAMIFFLLIFLAFIFGFSYIAIPESRIAGIALDAKQSYFLTEAGVEDVAYRIRNAMNYSPTEVITLNGSSATITTIDTGGSQREITAQGDVSSAVRKVKTTLKLGTGVSFNYGVQVGEEGLTMGNGSSIVGNVFSNGNIAGNGASQSTITGTAQVAGSSSIEDVTVSEDAYAGSFDDCVIGNIAHYVTSFTDCSAASTQLLSPPLDPQDFPITQTQIDAWKNEAAAGGTLSGYSLGSNASASLGLKKIDGNLTLGNNSTLTLTGTVWITGTISFGNSDIIQLDPGYGSNSGILIVDGAIDIGNTAILRGSGQQDSYLMLLSTYGPGDAIDVGNSASTAIFYAPNGVIDIGNNLSLQEATGYGLDVGNNATITYDTGLANANFISGPGGSFEIQSWKEIE